MKSVKILRVITKALSFAALSLGLSNLQAAPQLLPGVYGYGLDRASNTAGFGATSKIVHVTTLADNGNDTTPTPGSLRAAVKVSGARVVVFDVSGIIELQKVLAIRSPNLTIAGQTAPSPGIALHGQPLVVATSNVLIQHLRVRPGDRWLPNPNTSNRDAVAADSGNSTVIRNVVFDHCTFAWSLDEMASTWNAYEDVTFNKCIFAEPLFRSIHLDEGTFPNNVPPAVEDLAVTPTGFGDPVPVTHPAAIGGSYREWEASGDGATLDFIVKTLPTTNQFTEEHIVLGGITGPDRARFKLQVWTMDGTSLQESIVFDEYSPTSEAVSYVGRTDINGFTVPLGTTELKVRVTVMGRNPASTGWKIGIDLFSFSQGHAMGPLFGSGKEGTGRLSFNNNVIAHILERGPWVAAKQFQMVNNVFYNRRNRFAMMGNTDYWPDPMNATMVGNTFIDGQNMGTSARPAIARQKIAAGSRLFETDNTYDPGDRTNASPLYDPLLEPYRVTSSPIEGGHGTDGYMPLPSTEAYRAVLLSVGARPNDRDIMEVRVMNDIAVGATQPALLQRPGKTKNNVIEAGGWPVYAQNPATWTLPANPNDDDDHDGYTNIEQWLQQLSDALEGTAVAGNNYQAEFAQLGGGSVIVTGTAGPDGTGYVTAPGAGTVTFYKVDGGTGGARYLRIRYALDGAARSATVVVNGAAQGVTFAPTGGASAWVLLDVPATLAGGTNNVVSIQGTAAGLPNVDDVTVTGTDILAPVITAPGDLTTDATGPDGASVSFDVSALDAVDGNVTPTVTPASGSLFAPGVTSVHVTATDAAGNTSTRDFTVTVLTHEPAIATQPASQTVTSGDTVTFTVAATGTPELTYEWQRNGVALGAPSAPSLTLPAVQTSAAADYSVVVTNAFGSVTSVPATLTVNKVPVTVAFGQLAFSYSGSAKPATVTTVPDGLPVTITYNGSTTPPTLPGTYTVVATVTDPNFAGSITTTLTILPDILVNHAPTLNGAVGGSIQVLLPEDITLNGNAAVDRQLLVPGTPTVQLNGHPTYGGVSDGPGAATPTTHRITLNGNARLGSLLRHVDPIALPVVSAPPAPTGTRNVSINSTGQGAGDFATLRDLTLNGNVGIVAVPPGTYGRFTANGGSNFQLGIAGATTPAVYNLQGLTLNGNRALEVVGPVVLTLASGTSFNASLGNAAHPEWLEVRVASGGITLNGNVACYGSIIAPQGTVIVNGSTQLAGHVVADRFTINGNGTLANPSDQTAPIVAITAPAAAATVNGTVEVLATATDNAGVAAVQFQLDGAALGLEDMTAPFGVSWPTLATAPGSHVLTAVARDFEGNFTTSAAVQVTVADQIPPTVALTAPAAGTSLGGVVTLSATAADDVAVTGVQFLLDGANFGPELATPPYATNWNTASTAPGAHTLAAIARDAAGHATTSAAVAITVSDQHAPSITLTSPADGAKVGGVVTLTAESSDDVGIAGVQFKVNGTALGAEVTAPPYTAAWNTVPLTETSYALTAVARDAAGHLTESAPVTVSVANAIFDTFESGSTAAWTPDGGTWTLTEEPGTHTWRQSDKTSVAIRATRDVNWADTLVEADVKLLSVSGSNRFFGVVARRQGLNDYYYLVLRTNNTIELKKIVNNTAANLVNPVAFTVAPNTTYRLALEVVGTTLKGYVNGQLKLQASDATFASGAPGLLTYFTEVAFDDVHLDPTPISPVLATDDFEHGATAWVAEAGTWSVESANSQVYRQADPAAPARAVTGQPGWADQIVELDVTPRSFGQTGGWAGFLFRYVDATHHYAVALRDGNKLELLKVEGAAVTTLATATTPVTAGTVVALRLNAVGNSFKVYRDGNLLLQAVDDAYPAGQLVLATAGAAADFDDVSVIAP